MNNKDALQVEYTEIQAEMSGISPKLAIYQKLAKRKKEIEDIIGDGVITYTKIRKTRSKQGRYLAPFQKVHG